MSAFSSLGKQDIFAQDQTCLGENPMRTPYIIILILACVSAGSERGLAAVDCSPVKPNTGTDKTIEDNFKGHAQVILKSLGSGDIENGYKETEADTLSKYPNADQLLLWRSYIYIACSLLQSSSQWNDDQKFERLIQLISLYNKPPPTEMPQDAAAQDSLNGQSHGFVVQARCARSGVPVVCIATIVNQDPNRVVVVSVNETKLYNANSKAYPASEGTVAGIRGSNHVSAKLLQGHPAEASFQFNMPSADRELAELDIPVQVNYETFLLEAMGTIHLK